MIFLGGNSDYSVGEEECPSEVFTPASLSGFLNLFALSGTWFRGPARQTDPSTALARRGGLAPLGMTA